MQIAKEGRTMADIINTDTYFLPRKNPTDNMGYIVIFEGYVLSRLSLNDFLHIRAKAALITIPADKAMPGIGTAFTSLKQGTNGTFLPHRRIFR
jgi:hypothetical protein